MQPHSFFSTTRVLWALCFASHLVLLVVLLGRERAKRFPLFTASIVLMTLRLLFEMLLVGRMPMVPLQWTLLSAANLGEVMAVLVLVEVARLSFPTAKASAWLIATPVVVALSGAALTQWGPLPKAADLSFHTQIDVLRTMQLVWQKSQIFTGLLTVGLLLLVILFGRRFQAKWWNHSTQILIGLAVLALAWLGMTGYWQHLTHQISATTSREDYQKILDFGTLLYNAYRVAVIVAAVWWVGCMWVDEAGTATAASVPATESVALPELAVEAETTENEQ